MGAAQVAQAMPSTTASQCPAETPANDRIPIEGLLDWHLIYCCEADYRAIVATTPFRNGDLAFEYEPLRANLFAVLCRA